MKRVALTSRQNECWLGIELLWDTLLSRFQFLLRNRRAGSSNLRYRFCTTTDCSGSLNAAAAFSNSGSQCLG